MFSSFKERSAFYLIFRIFSLIRYSRLGPGVVEDSGFYRGHHWTFRV